MHHGWAYTPFSFHVSLASCPFWWICHYQSQLGVVTTTFLAVSSVVCDFVMMDKSLLFDLFPKVQ